jgi:hypothetical protein
LLHLFREEAAFDWRLSPAAIELGDMGFWSVLLEIARAVAPHAAPHVARAVVDAAKERRAAGEAAREQADPQPSVQDLANALTYLEQRLSAAEERAAAAEEKLAVMEARNADLWMTTRKWAIGLMVWNAVGTAALIVLAIIIARR